MDQNTTLTDNVGVTATLTGGGYDSDEALKWTTRHPLLVNYVDTDGNQQTVTVTYSIHSITANCPNGNYSISTTSGMVDSVTFPDGSGYAFTYYSDGQIASMRVPTGGTATVKGKRDYAILALLAGCALRRRELASLTVEDIQMRENRWVIIDLVGKGGRVRTVAIPVWVKKWIDAWQEAGGIKDGPLLRSVGKGGKGGKGRGKF